jgi:hypothetical protein
MRRQYLEGMKDERREVERKKGRKEERKEDTK